MTGYPFAMLRIQPCRRCKLRNITTAFLKQLPKCSACKTVIAHLNQESGIFVWARYSDKHRGLCLGFEIPDNAGRRVDYIDDRLVLPDRLELGHAAACVYTKYVNWSYEKEIRCVSTLEEQSHGLYFMEFGESLKLVEVIVGTRCKLTQNDILEGSRPLNNVTLIKARPGFRRFEIVEDLRGF